ncbi:glycine oxidase ThiO [Capsulimonas corticalis]|uniref:glycine oxidase n=1 Tax=Capsulimonas corticalis TaxID=2219043 RepID=A0A402D3I8_9BACT|nr:glycine oxidase ThiO [Capsulimonas corticalis]
MIGLSLTVRLAQRGVRVAVVDNHLPGQATHAAAGMLAPLSEASGDGPILELGLASLEAYPDFVEQVAVISKLPLRIEGNGLLRIAQSDDEAKHLKAAFHRRSHLSLPQELLTAEDLREAEPLLSPAIALAVRSPAERHIQPRLLLAALWKAAENLGAEIFASEAVTSILHNGARIQAVQTECRTVPCGQCVLCGGAWSAAAAAMLTGTTLPVTPLKGQIAVLELTGSPLLRHTIYAHSRYLVPRDNGEIVIGATEEPEAGFDAATHPYTISRLRLDAEALVPALSGLPLSSAWSGLRPASPDGLPILGRLPHWDNAHAATGHGRNGILLAPQTADLLTACILDGQDPPQAFSPQRFEARS